MRENTTILPSIALLWPIKSKEFSKISKNQYNACFRLASELEKNGVPILIVNEIDDIKELWNKYPEISLCIPVFFGSHGWWFPLTQTNQCPSPQITEKIIVSPECIMYLAKCQKTETKKPLMVAEIKPETKFFEKLPRESALINDMLATSHGTILTLIQTLKPRKVMKTICDTNNFFHGVLGTTINF